MASRKGNPVHGWVILDKPEGLSSSRAVGIVRRVFNAAKAGHGGTLDPLATGILPIALGEATKTVSFAMHGEGDRLCRLAERDGKDSCRQRVEGAAMARLGRVENAAHDADGTRRAQPLGLVENHPAMHGIALARCHAAAVSLRCGCC